ncbi:MULTISPECIES: hypothetical protein [Streptomyces]|uniref:hypothetical protein n=1 Tax=Streptomyces TaxID=1883 RepID=UPI0033A5192D
MNETDLMQLARQAIEDEDNDRLNAKAAELATADERARLEAEQEAKRAHAREVATKALNAKGVTLPDVARKFDAAVAALVALAESADLRNRTIRQQSAVLTSVGAVEQAGSGGNTVYLNGERHSIQDAKVAELMARALAVSANEVTTSDNGLRNLASVLGAHSGPLHRLTAVERAAR